MDIRNFHYEPYTGRVDLLAAGVPCQPFSLGGKHQGSEDNRNLFPALLDAVRIVWPKAILVENVRGLVRPGFLPYFDYVMDQVRLPGFKLRKGENWKRHAERLAGLTNRDRGLKQDSTYHVQYKLIECADHGVPQLRKRVIAIALRRDIADDWTWPAASHSQDALLYSQWVDERYWKVHGIEPPPVPLGLIPTVAALRKTPPPATQPWSTVRDAFSGLPEPSDGIQHPRILNHAGIAGARVYPGHSGSSLDWPAKTLKAGVHGVPGGEATLLLSDGKVRYFTVRESARLQTFPDEFELRGVRSEAMRQIGNAVPVRLAERMGRAIAAVLRKP